MSSPRAGIAALLIALPVLAGCTVTSTVAGSPTVDGKSTSAFARDGNLAFEVATVEQRDTVGNPAKAGYSVTAKGVFVVVSLRIRNVGNQPVTFVDAHQTLVDVTGRPYAADRAADIYGNPDVPSTRMAPGEELRVQIAFDVPRGTQPRELRLRDSATSAGVAVALG